MNKNLNEATNRQVLKLQELCGKAIANAMPSADEAQKLIGNPSALYEAIAKLFNKTPETKIARDLKRTWTKIYGNWFGCKVDFAELIIPIFYDPAKHFAVIVAQGITMNEVVSSMRKKFNVRLYTEDLNLSVTTNDRIADKDYVIIFNKNIEADYNLRNISANKLAEMNISGITLLERLLLEIYYFNNTKKHLDIKNWTLCSGSRDSDGNVPDVCWRTDDSNLYVDCDGVDNCNHRLRTRAVVSLAA